MVEEDERFTDFMCSCGEDNQRHCDEVYEEVRDEISIEGEDKDRLFTTAIVYSLNWGMKNGMAQITDIPNDQWSAIAVDYTQITDTTEEGETQQFFVQCDQIHHGLARVYQLVKAYDESLVAG